MKIERKELTPIEGTSQAQIIRCPNYSRPLTGCRVPSRERVPTQSMTVGKCPKISVRVSTSRASPALSSNFPDPAQPADLGVTTVVNQGSFRTGVLSLAAADLPPFHMTQFPSSELSWRAELNPRAGGLVNTYERIQKSSQVDLAPCRHCSSGSEWTEKNNATRQDVSLNRGSHCLGTRET